MCPCHDDNNDDDDDNDDEDDDDEDDDDDKRAREKYVRQQDKATVHSSMVLRETRKTKTSDQGMMEKINSGPPIRLRFQHLCFRL
jgi:hypothetical protein